MEKNADCSRSEQVLGTSFFRLFKKNWSIVNLQCCVSFMYTATWLRKVYLSISIYGRRQWHPTPVLLSGKSHRWRSLVGCSPWGREKSDMTEWLHFHFPLSCIGEGNQTHSSVLAWRIPWTKKPGRLQSMGSHRVGQDWSDLQQQHIYIYTYILFQTLFYYRLLQHIEYS